MGLSVSRSPENRINMKKGAKDEEQIGEEKFLLSLRSDFKLNFISTISSARLVEDNGESRFALC